MNEPQELFEKLLKVSPKKENLVRFNVGGDDKIIISKDSLMS
jgi:hypothetical protein